MHMNKVVSRVAVIASRTTKFTPKSTRFVSAVASGSQSRYFCSKPEPVEAEIIGESKPTGDAKTTETAPPPEETEKPFTDKVEKTEKVVGPSSSHEFQAETRKLLDIVAKSLYTDKEIFLRELVSNASDALEKFRQTQVAGTPVIDAYIEPEIQITADAESNTITIQDFGIGMKSEELISNLGTIARSGTLEYVKTSDSPESLIGQFGVGFYSCFMVSDTVEVYSRSALEGSKGYLWKSDGSGSYDLAEAEGVSRGTKIILHLREDCKEYSGEKVLKDILTKHSNFVNFKIKLNGEHINNIEAIWTLSKNEVTEEQHEDFYKFISHSYDKPRMRLHFKTDSPLNLSSLFYIPNEHTEKYGVGRMEPGVSLYCRKVLIQHNMKKFLPDYLRFVKGIVDCEDIPLNISREHLQDSHLIGRLSSMVTRKLIKFFADESKRDPEAYEGFFNEYAQFIKEGIVSESNDRENLAKLLRMETSSFEAGKLSSLEDYMSRMPDDQKEIFYVVANKRSLAEGSPYMEHFKKNGIEVLFMYQNIDDWVMNAVSTFKGKKVKPIESAEIPAEEKSVTEDERVEIKNFNEWIKDTLSEKVSSVKDTNRLTDTPAVIIDHESIAYRRMMMQVDPKRMPKLPKQALEINLEHPVMKNLRTARDTNPSLATQVLEQVYDNAMLAAGLLTDNRPMLDRINSILAQSLESQPEKSFVETQQVTMEDIAQEDNGESDGEDSKAKEVEKKEKE